MEIKIDLTVVGQIELTLEVESGDSIDNVKDMITEKRDILLINKCCIMPEKCLMTGAHCQSIIFRNKTLWFCN